MVLSLHRLNLIVDSSILFSTPMALSVSDTAGLLDAHALPAGQRAAAETLPPLPSPESPAPALPPQRGAKMGQNGAKSEAKSQ